ncbi:hypothetical protein [Paenibacillus polymyxa]|uniref:hypothetical protein n=1 Tax=Paenibacillus polymyxa TaxID=1406 RepID=UPI001ABBB36B|nr:hypothetical protein [Paenibacillus polymyxa]MBO3284747.1 hypothetical protein [Paenibacillus polymyxa]
MTIDTGKLRSHERDEWFVKVPAILFRLYPQLEGFTVETAGFYGYLRSWCQSKPDHRLYGKTWLNQREIEAQTGLSPYKIRQHTTILQRYGLLNVTKSDRIPNKLIYEPLEPLTYAEFYEKYGIGGSAEDERSSDVS